MRCYVLCESDHRGIPDYIVAEVVRDKTGDDPQTTLASALVGERAQIVTREELLADPATAVALGAWDAKNDDGFDRESAAIMSDRDVTGPQVRLLTLCR